MTIESLVNSLTTASQPGAILRSVQNGLRNPQFRRTCQMVGGAAAVLTICTIGYNIYALQSDDDSLSTAWSRQNVTRRSQAPPKEATLLDKQLHIAASIDNPEICRQLILQKADPNIQSEKGQTALEIAVSEERWLTCKALIDNKAKVTKNLSQKITSYLAQQKVDPKNHIVFMSPFPNPNCPEIYRNGQFFPLRQSRSLEQESNRLPLAIYFVCEENLNEYYGGTSLKLTNIYKNFKEIAQHYKLIRTRVNDKNALIPLIDEIKSFYPNTSLDLFIINGHGAKDRIQIGKESFLTRNDSCLFYEIGLRVKPWKTIVTAGCYTSYEPPAPVDEGFTLLHEESQPHSDLSSDTGNITQSFSSNAPTQIVCGCTDKLYDLVPTVFQTTPTSSPTFLPYFEIIPNQDKSSKVSIYMNGRKVAEGGPSSGIVKKLRPLLRCSDFI